MVRTLFVFVLLVLGEGSGERARQELSPSQSGSPKPAMAKSSPADAHPADVDANGKQTNNLKIRLELPSQENEAVIGWDTPFRVVVVNESEQPIRIWDPNSKEGWNQFEVHFRNLKTGKTHVAKRRVIDDPEYWKAAADRLESDSGVIEVAAKQTYETNITLSEFAAGRTSVGRIAEPQYGRSV